MDSVAVLLSQGSAPCRAMSVVLVGGPSTDSISESHVSYKRRDHVPCPSQRRSGPVTQPRRLFFSFFFCPAYCVVPRFNSETCQKRIKNCPEQHGNDSQWGIPWEG